MAKLSFLSLAVGCPLARVECGRGGVAVGCPRVQALWPAAASLQPVRGLPLLFLQASEGDVPGDVRQPPSKASLYLWPSKASQPCLAEPVHVTLEAFRKRRARAFKGLPAPLA